MIRTTRASLLAALLLPVVLAVAACGGGTSTATPTPTPDGEASTEPSVDPGSSVDPEASVDPNAPIPSFDLSALTAGLPGVDSYRTSFSEGGVVSYTTVVVTKPVLSKAITTFDDDGTVRERFIVIGDDGWTASGEDGAFEPIPAGLTPSMLLAFDPTLMLAGYASADLGSIGADQGTEDKNGVQARHVKIDSTSALGLSGAIPAGAAIDLWIAEAGYIVAWEMTGFPNDSGFSVQVTNVNDPSNVVEAP